MVNQERTMTYDEAKAEADAALFWKGGDPIGDSYVTTLTAGALRVLLAGPPEPSEEEVAALMWSFLWNETLGMKGITRVPSELFDMAGETIKDSYRRLSQAVQQLYRSRRNDGRPEAAG